MILGRIRLFNKKGCFMNIFYKAVGISLCLLGILHISLHAADNNAILNADNYIHKIHAGERPTPAEVRDYEILRARFNVPNNKEDRLWMFEFFKSSVAHPDALDRVYAYLHPDDRAA